MLLSKLNDSVRFEGKLVTHPVTYSGRWYFRMLFVWLVVSVLLKSLNMSCVRSHVNLPNC